MRASYLALAVFAGLPSVAAFAQSTKSVWTGIYTPAQAAAGEELYFAGCARCHGDDLAGLERAPALAGGTFNQRWDGANLKKLFEKVEQMPPDDPAARLTPPKSADVLAFLLSANDVPSGTATLAPDKDALAGITYTSQRPK